MSLHDTRYPGETDAYRAARDRLLEAERDLRRQTEAVAAQRRALPLGGRLKQDYVFDGPNGPVAFADLFRPGQDSLIAYSFMHPPGGPACPMCTAMLDGLNGTAPHIMQRVSIAIVGKAPYAELAAFAARRGWDRLPLLSSAGNSYNADYFGERDDFGQMPMCNVFRRTPDGIFHTWGSELLFAPADEGQNNRHVDMLWPLWSAFDLTPDGRGSDWYPDLSYA